jgi:hypothetical protein
MTPMLFSPNICVFTADFAIMNARSWFALLLLLQFRFWSYLLTIYSSACLLWFSDTLFDIQIVCFAATDGNDTAWKVLDAPLAHGTASHTVKRRLAHTRV